MTEPPSPTEAPGGGPTATGDQPPQAAGPHRRQGFGRGLGVLAGWYAMVLAAVGLWIGSHSAAMPQDCNGLGCMSPRGGAILVSAYVGVFLLPVSLVLALATLGLAARRARTGLLAGTLAAAVGLSGGAVVVTLLGLWPQ